MKKKIMMLAFGAAFITAPAIAATGAEQRNPDAEWTRAEAQAEAAQLFARLDINRDGKLDAADRLARQAQRQEARFAAMDANKDGAISKAEWDKHAADQAARAQERRTARMAARGSKDTATGDAARPGERAHMGRSGGPRHAMMHGGRSGRHFGGPAGDKAVTQAEFVAQALARFDAMDANKDGKVTKEERAAARAAMAGKRGALRGGGAATPAK